MSSDSAFISYAHADKDAVDEIVGWIRERGLPCWYSGQMMPGEFEKQINDQIENCSVVIAFLTEAGVGKDASTWVQHELEKAKEMGKIIFPCIIGSFILPQDVRGLIHRSHQVRVEAFEDLKTHDNFAHCIEALKNKDTIEKGAHSFSDAQAIKSKQGVEAWYDKMPDYTDQALALAVASLPDTSKDLVTQAAYDLIHMIEGGLRDLTDEELAKQPRNISMYSLNQQLERIKATTVRVRHPQFGNAIEIIRFEEPNWDYDLLDHVWTSRLETRAIFLEWLEKVATDTDTHEFGRHAANALGVLAREHMSSITTMVLSRWLDRSDSKKFFHLLPLVIDVLRAAIENPENLGLVREILLNLAKEPRRQNEDVTGPQAALSIALSQVGLRRPQLAIAIMKYLGWRVFNPENFRIVTRSPAFYGSQSLEDAKVIGASSETEETEQEDEQAESAESSGAPTVENDDIPNDDLSSDDATEEKTNECRSASLPAMEFLAALADWANEPIKARNRDEQEDGKWRRQVPILSMLLILDGMPLLNQKRPNRLTLEEVMRLSDRWDEKVLDRIFAGLYRAAKATRYRGKRRPLGEDHYFAPRHLSDVLGTFAKERWYIQKGRVRRSFERPDNDLRFKGDPLLEFARILYQNLSAGGEAAQGPHKLVTHKMKRYLSSADLDFIQSKTAITTLESST